MKGTLAGIEVALDAGALLLVADVAFHLEPLIVEFPTELSDPKMLSIKLIT